jgi:hypothetical protein
MAGGLIAFYQLGYGVAAFGIGPLQGLFGLSFSTVFAAGSVVAAPIIVIAWLVIRPARNTQAAPKGEERVRETTELDPRGNK